MPHLTLSYSANFNPPGDLRGVFEALHRDLAELTGLKLDFFKSRAVRCDHFLVGDGAANQAFAHLDILIFPDRPLELRQAITEAAMAILNERLGPLPEETTLQITVDLGNLDKETYRKSTKGGAR